MINGAIETGKYLFEEGMIASWKGTLIGGMTGALCAKTLFDQIAKDHTSSFGAPYLDLVVESVHIVTAASILGTAAGFVAGVVKGILRPAPPQPLNDPSFILGALAVSTSIAIPLHLLLNSDQ